MEKIQYKKPMSSDDRASQIIDGISSDEKYLTNFDPKELKQMARTITFVQNRCFDHQKLKHYKIIRYFIYKEQYIRQGINIDEENQITAKSVQLSCYEIKNIEEKKRKQKQQFEKFYQSQKKANEGIQPHPQNFENQKQNNSDEESPLLQAKIKKQ